MREKIEELAGPYNWYKVRRAEYDTNEKIPFRVSPNPLKLSPEQAIEIAQIGQEVNHFMQAADELYRKDETVHKLLNTGKPEVFLLDQPAQYLFVRPDLIMTKAGFCLCEIETSPFGLGLAELLNRAYTQAGFETLAESSALTEYIRQNTPTGGYFLYSPKTAAYAGQITFLSEQVFSDAVRKWQTLSTTDAQAQPENINWNAAVYRGFYLSEYLSDPNVRAIIDRQVTESSRCVLPSFTPHLEEKALLALLWDTRYEEFFKNQLGEAAFYHLRTVVPETWIVGQEKYFAPGLPNNFSNTLALASLSRSKRTFVLKPSGFNNQSSWSEGVELLHEKSGEKAAELIHQAEKDQQALHIVQRFQKAKDVPMNYENGNEMTPMLARVRITPYFSLQKGEEGHLLTIKATACENTDFIHGSTASINTAVGT